MHEGAANVSASGAELASRCLRPRELRALNRSSSQGGDLLWIKGTGQDFF